MIDKNREPLPGGVVRSTSVLPTTKATSPRAKKHEAGNQETPQGVRGRITDIEEQVRHKDRVNVYIDGKFAIGLFADVAVALALKVGQEVTPERLTELADAENRRKAREDAYRLLSFRARTEKEITDRLKRREYDEEVIADTVRYLHEQHLLDDADFAARFAASRSRTHGDRAITMELRQKGVSADTIKETLAENADEDTEHDTVRTLAVKRVGEHPSDRSPQAKQKLWAFLARRGFGSDVIKRVIAELYSGSTEDVYEDD
jgi:regulatory protein